MDLNGKTVFATGVAGFIGSKTAEKLIGKGARVIGVDNLNDYYDVSLKEKRLAPLQALDGFEFTRCDIEDFSPLAKIFAENQIDAVVNLAARAGVRYSMENPHVYYTTNVMGSLNLLQLMRKHGIRKYVLASTSSLYAGQPMPFREDLPVNEPISPYAASKKAAEVMAYSYHHLFDIDVTVVRYFTVYGPAGRPDMSIFRFIKWIDQEQPIQLFGDGTQSRDFTYVDDIAEGTIAAIRPVGFETINLGGGNQPVSLNEVISQLEDLLGKKAIIDQHPAHIADLKETWADIGKANRILDWQPTISLDDGLAASVNWYRENHPWSAEVPV